MSCRELLLVLAFAATTSASSHGVLRQMVRSNNPEYEGLLVPADVFGIENQACDHLIEDDLIRRGLSECYGHLTYGEAWVQLNNCSRAHNLPPIGQCFSYVIPYINANAEVLHKLAIRDELESIQAINCDPYGYWKLLCQSFKHKTLEEIFNNGEYLPILAGLLGDIFQQLYANGHFSRETMIHGELMAVRELSCDHEYMARLFERFDDATLEEIFSSEQYRPILADMLGDALQGWMNLIVGVDELED